MDKPLPPSSLPLTHPAFYVDGPDHVIGTDLINGRFAVYVVGDINASYTDSNGVLHQVTSVEELISSGAAEHAADIVWVDEPRFKLIDEQGLEVFGEDFTDSATPMKIAQERALLHTSNE